MKAWQRALRAAIWTIALVLIPFLLFVFCLWMGIGRPYIRFTTRSQNYYTELARACDQVLQQHPLGSNAVTVEVADSPNWVYVRLKGNDSSLPRLIQDMGPSEVTISTNSVLIMVGDSRMGYGVSWSPRGYDSFTGGQTNVWDLEAHGEGVNKVVYSKTRH